MIAEEFGIVSEIVCYNLLWKIVKQVLPERWFWYTNMLALLEPGTGVIRTDTVDQAAEAEDGEDSS